MLKERRRPKNWWAPTLRQVFSAGIPLLFFNLAGFSEPFQLFPYDMFEVVPGVGCVLECVIMWLTSTATCLLLSPTLLHDAKQSRTGQGERGVLDGLQWKQQRLWH